MTVCETCFTETRTFLIALYEQTWQLIIVKATGRFDILRWRSLLSVGHKQQTFAIDFIVASVDSKLCLSVFP